MDVSCTQCSNGPWPHPPRFCTIMSQLFKRTVNFMLPKGPQNGFLRRRLCIPKKMNFRGGGGSFPYQIMLQIFLFIEAIFEHELMPKPANTKAPKSLYWNAQPSLEIPPHQHHHNVSMQCIMLSADCTMLHN